MIYLLDASVLITAHNTYYALNRVPEFWSWLRFHGKAGTLKLPKEIYAEVEDGGDNLANWMSETASKVALQLDEDPDPNHLQTVLDCYGSNLTEADLITIGKDPFLIASGLTAPTQRCVVTAEVSKPSRTGARRHIPNVCVDCGLKWMSPVDLLRTLDFKTSWAGT